MKVTKCACAVAVASVLCGVETAQAHQELFAAFLSGAKQSPANGSLGIGTILITLDVDIVTMHVQMKFDGLTGNASGVQMHGRTTAAQTGTAGAAVPFPDFPILDH